MPDRRVKYTLLALRSSLLELMRKKDISRITVKELCERADVNRGTFYAHYASPVDLLEQIERELLEEVLSSLDSKLATGSLAAPMRRRATVPNCGVASLLYQQSGPVGYKLKNRKIAPFKNKILQFRIKYQLCQYSGAVKEQQKFFHSPWWMRE